MKVGMTKDSHLLWYAKAAKEWTQALPLGSGQLGAMVFGAVKNERIALNHDTLWSGYPKDTVRQGSSAAFRQAQALVREGKLLQAQKLLEEEHNSVWSQAYMPLGDLLLDFAHGKSAQDYRRELDLTTALHRTGYRCGKASYSREIFASYADHCIALRLCAENGTLDFEARFDTKHHCVLHSENGLLLLDGECPGEHNMDNIAGKAAYFEEPEKRGIRFRAALRVITDGEVQWNAQSVRVKNAQEAVLLVSAFTSFRAWNMHPFLQGKEYGQVCIDHMLALPDYAQLRERHLADYKELFERVTLDLGSDGRQDMPTDKRLQEFKRGKADRALYVLLFHFGRYLAIASSRPGTQPMNLQGIWNAQYDPPWKSNYTVNINTEMNYWPVLPCAMPELNEPLVQMLRELSAAGERTAREHYGAPGFTCHHNVDIWRLTTPVSGSAVWSFWPFGSGWLCRNLFTHFTYTMDMDFLRETVYPILCKAAHFYISLLTPDAQGNLCFSPATSPENNFLYEGRKCAVAPSTTMGNSIIRDLFQNLLKAAQYLEIADECTQQVADALARLQPFRIGSKGQLLEWEEEYTETEPGHRHVSHLYGLHPAHLISPEDTPELAEACKRTLQLRGDEGTGWSLGWKINFWARLHDGNHALRLLERQLRPVKSQSYNMHNGGGTYENLFDAHPPFQIDGNFGAVSGITEMLLQSEPGKLHILPALPDKWQDGRVEGLAACGNIRVDIAWQNAVLTTCSLHGSGNVTLRYGNKTRRVQLNGGKQSVSFDD